MHLKTDGLGYQRAVFPGRVGNDALARAGSLYVALEKNAGPVDLGMVDGKHIHVKDLGVDPASDWAVLAPAQRQDNVTFSIDESVRTGTGKPIPTSPTSPLKRVDLPTDKARTPVDLGDPDMRSIRYMLTKVGIARVLAMHRRGELTPVHRPHVVIIDDDFTGHELLKGVNAPRAVPAWLPDVAPVALSTPPAAPARGADPAVRVGHGTAAARCIQAITGGDLCSLSLLSYLPAGESRADAEWMGPVGLMLAIAAAIREEAHVIVIPASSVRWGMPPYLDLALKDAAARGITVVVSVGSATENLTRSGDQGGSAALGADELASHPCVMAVAATDEDGSWYRRHAPGAEVAQSPINRFGPSVCVSAPGFFVLQDYRGGLLRLNDDSSLACAVVGGCVALVSAFSRLAGQDLREIMVASAEMPLVVDRGLGMAHATFNGVDRTGHSFKVGHGEINATAAVLLAVDPLAAALVNASPRTGTAPGWRTTQRTHHVLVAQQLVMWCSRNSHRDCRDYVRLGPELARLGRRDPAMREALTWLGRHLGAIFQYPADTGDWARSGHQALAARMHHLLDVTHTAAGTAPGPVEAQVVALCAALRMHLPASAAAGEAFGKQLRAILDMTDADLGEEERL